MTPKVIVWSLIALWVAALTVHDWRTRRVPNWAVYPLLPVALAVALLWPLHGIYGSTEAVFIALGLLACGMIWFMRVLSGGDIKLAVPLVILLPYPDFYWAFLAIGMIGSVLMLALWDGGARWRRFRALFLTTLASPRLPSSSVTRAEFEGAHPPATWLVGLPAIIVILEYVTAGHFGQSP